MIPSIGLTIICVALLIGFIYMHNKKDQSIQREREQWQEERKDLMNRIQSGNYAEYKTQEIRLVKAQNGEKEPPKLEQL